MTPSPPPPLFQRGSPLPRLAAATVAEPATSTTSTSSLSGETDELRLLIGESRNTTPTNSADVLLYDITTTNQASSSSDVRYDSTPTTNQVSSSSSGRDVRYNSTPTTNRASSSSSSGRDVRYDSTPTTNQGGSCSSSDVRYDSTPTSGTTMRINVEPATHVHVRLRSGCTPPLNALHPAPPPAHQRRPTPQSQLDDGTRPSERVAKSSRRFRRMVASCRVND